MESALLYDRLQFAFTVTFHYLFPQLTMGLALLIVYFKTLALRSSDRGYHEAARFWTKLFALSFAFGVVTGIPMEFQFGTNWAKFSMFAGGVIGQALAMEGLFSFFLESSFLGVLLFGEKKIGQKGHWFAACMLFVGSWLSGYFIIATNAWMQHPVAYSVANDGSVHLNSLWGLLTNPYLFWQYLHTMTAAVATASFVMAGVGAFYYLSDQHLPFAKMSVRTGVVAGALASMILSFPTGHENARQVFADKPVAGAAMEGLFYTERGAGMTLVGQPNMETLTIDNPLIIPDALSFLLYDDLWAKVKGLEAFPREEWPDNIPLLYYSYHIMITLGTMFLAIMGGALVLLWRGLLFTKKWKWFLWIVLFIAPFPYIATTAGWMTAELGRQPWLVYGLLKTSEGISPLVHSGNALFTLLGFVGMYFLMGVLFLFLFWELVSHGPKSSDAGADTRLPESQN